MSAARPRSARWGVLSILRSQPGSNQGVIMADKSPRQHLTKKAGKSLKEKRADKHAKADANNKVEIVPPGKKKH